MSCTNVVFISLHVQYEMKNYDLYRKTFIAKCDKYDKNPKILDLEAFSSLLELECRESKNISRRENFGDSRNLSTLEITWNERNFCQIKKCSLAIKFNLKKQSSYKILFQKYKKENFTSWCKKFRILRNSAKNSTNGITVFLLQPLEHFTNFKKFRTNLKFTKFCTKRTVFKYIRSVYIV